MSTNATRKRAASDEDLSAWRGSIGSRVGQALSPTKFGAGYVLIAAIIVFSLLRPSLFPRWATVTEILNTNSVNALAALALIVPMSAGVFDISIPYTMTMSGVFTASYIVNSHLPVPEAMALAMGIALIIGCVNGFVVVVAKIDPLVGTLATGFLIQALVLWRSGSQVISGSGLSTGLFQGIGNHVVVAGLTLPVFYAAILAIALWYLLQHTATGRRLYATGFNREATRLAGIKTDLTRFGALIVSSVLAGFAGIVLASTIGSGSPTAGNNYLLPAFAAVFLGATQFRPGFFNAAGTILAVVLLGTLTTGLSLVGAAEWLQQMTIGVVLLAALALTGLEVRQAGSEWRNNSIYRSLLRIGNRSADASTASATETPK